MGTTIDHVQDVDVSSKIDQVADLIRHAARKGIKDKTLDFGMLQCIIENGGLFQERVFPTMVRVGSVNRLIDSELLEPVSMVTVPAVESFSAVDKFRKDTVDGVVIGYIWDGFRDQFLVNGGKKEENVPAQNLRIHKLRQGSVDGPIIEELGGEGIVETNLAHVWELLKNQGQGQSGDLLTNGNANIFYVRTTVGGLWAVYCYWDAGYRCWRVSAYPVTYPSGWDAGYQVFSR